jgi:hypothetical protein
LVALGGTFVKIEKTKRRLRVLLFTHGVKRKIQNHHLNTADNTDTTAEAVQKVEWTMTLNFSALPT